jgi:2-methylcitrate dehydratase
MAVANAHPFGARPFRRDQYIQKFKTLTEGLISEREVERFLGQVQRLPQLKAEELAGLNLNLPKDRIERAERDSRGIF